MGRVIDPTSVAALLATHHPDGALETADLARIRTLADPASGPSDPWRRTLPIHLTASAVIVHPASGRVLLRWHERHRTWLHVGGHGDPGETDALAVAVREAVEETGLGDVRPWPDARLVHVAVVEVPASATEPAHEHADLRFVLATGTPRAARPESATARLRWVAPAEACSLTGSASLRQTLARVQALLA